MAGRFVDSDEIEESHEINITPFIDVMLVLLIIFMVAAPLSTVDIPVELPVAQEEPVQRPAEPVFVTIEEDFSLAVGEIPTTLEQLGIELSIATGLDREARIYIRADRSVPYGEMMNVMNAMRGEGYLKIGLVGLDPSAAEPEADTAEDAAQPPLE